MKIRQLDLKAFGPFTDRLLNFNVDRPGLHIIFGPNEAGKSSSLRALKAWLFGFPERTLDNFVHTNDNLLIGGTLLSEDGQELSFFRRKKRKIDMLDLNGDPVPPGKLAAFLPILDPLVFEALYGIDHDGLIRGGEDILAQKGDVGQTLFSAGAGISSLRGVISDLEEQTEGLFKVRGSKPRINESIAKYKTVRKTVKEAALSSREWKAMQNELQKDTDQLNTVEQQRSVKDQERRKLERIRQALPHLTQRRHFQDKILALGTVVEIPAGFSEQRQALEKQVQEAYLDRTRFQQRLKELHDNLNNIDIDPQIFDHAESIKNLSERLGEYKKAMQDRPRLEGMRSSCRSDALISLKQVNQDYTREQVEELRPVFGKKRLIQSLAAKHDIIQQSIKQIEKQILKLAGDLQLKEKQLSKLGPVTETVGLRQAIHQARRLGDIDEKLKVNVRELQESQLSCREDLDKMGLWSGELSGLLSLPLPLPETINKFDVDFQNLTNRKKAQETQLSELQTRLLDVTNDIKILQQARQVPTENELTRIRLRRDQGWILLRKQWIDGDDVKSAAKSYHNELNLPDAYEKNIEQADVTADRLRREAERVHQYSSLKTEETTLQEKLQDMKNGQETIASQWAGLTREWQACWKKSGVTPLSPKEMQAWLNLNEKLRLRVKENQKVEKEIASLREERQRVREKLLSELHPLEKKDDFPDESLDLLLTHCEQIFEQISNTVKEKQNLDEGLARDKSEQARLRDEKKVETKALEKWQQQWTDLLSDLAGDKDVLPEEAGDLLENLDNCFQKLDKADDFQKRINGIDADNKAFLESIAKVIEKTALNSAEVPIEQLVTKLKTRLTLAGENRALHQKYDKERQKAVALVKENALRIAELEKQLAHQCRIASVEKVEDLGVVEERFNRLREYQKTLTESENLLLEGAAGLTIEALEAQAKDADHDELTGRISTLTREIEQELDPQIKKFSELIGQKRSEISKMDGNARAAEALEESVQELAHLSKLINQYVTLKLATQILKQEIERYRAENQDPVLKIASKYFCNLTLNSFNGLRTDEDDQGRPILIGLRKDGSRIQVAQMSSGTRDQLYLTLRFASLEWKLQTSEPMPLILDDILVNFDDERSRATLTAMAELSAKTQVILFTHHGRIVEEAKKLNDPAALKILEL